MGAYGKPCAAGARPACPDLLAAGDGHAALSRPGRPGPRPPGWSILGAAMGELEIQTALDAEQRRLFTKKLLADLRALEALLDLGSIESGRHRMGAEQEVFLVDSRWQPAP